MSTRAQEIEQLERRINAAISGRVIGSLTARLYALRARNEYEAKKRVSAGQLAPVSPSPGPAGRDAARS